MKPITFSAYSSLSTIDYAALIQIQEDLLRHISPWNLQNDRKRLSFCELWTLRFFWNHHETQAAWKFIRSRHPRSYLFSPWIYSSCFDFFSPLSVDDRSVLAAVSSRLLTAAWWKLWSCRNWILFYFQSCFKLLKTSHADTCLFPLAVCLYLQLTVRCMLSMMPQCNTFKVTRWRVPHYQ